MEEYVIIGFYFRRHFYPNTFIGGVNCSNLTVTAAGEIIQQKVKDYQLTIKGKDHLMQKIPGDSIELFYQYREEAKDILKKQKSYFWISKVFGSHEIENPSKLVYDSEKLKEYLDNVCIPDRGKLIVSKNATISKYNKKTGFSIVKEVVGNELDRNLVKAAVEGAIHTLTREVSLEEKNCYIKPTIVSTTPSLKKALKVINGYMMTKLIYKFGNKTEVLDKELIGPAIIVDANHQVSINQEKIAAFVTYLANTYNNSKGTLRFLSSYKKEVVLKNVNYGWVLNEEQELKEIMECIKAGKQMEREPIPASDSPNPKYKSFGNTYVEICKEKQHLFFYKTGKLILESDVVTGIIKGGHDTPKGLYYVSQKQRNRTLRGFNDDGSKYAAFVSYWMRFNGGIGLHDAPWQPYFGGNRYRYAGSHGCVNLPPNVAKSLYENIELYTPVIVY